GLGFLDPYRYSDYGSPLVKKAYGEDFLLAMLRNAELGVPDVVLQSAEEYYDALDQNVRDAYIGTKTPEQAMEETAIAWEQITERIGRESQKEVWQLLKAFYSTK
ncbi:MAG: transcriptional antiterminator, partial [Chloroflexi bacterium]|nr:transcriptional antiterminator [Chloroflexota bacterium]